MKQVNHQTLSFGDEVIAKIGKAYFVDKVVQVTINPARTILLKNSGFFMNDEGLELYEASKKNKTLLLLQDISVEREED